MSGNIYGPGGAGPRRPLCHEKSIIKGWLEKELLNWKLINSCKWSKQLMEWAAGCE